MRSDEILFYGILISLCALFTADQVMDLGLIDRLNAPIELETVHFSEVQPIFQQRCVQCHSDSHWNWTDYEVAYRNRDKIKFKVWTLRNMPPSGMPNEDRLKIRDWVDSGAQK